MDVDERLQQRMADKIVEIFRQESASDLDCENSFWRAMAMYQTTK